LPRLPIGALLAASLMRADIDTVIGGDEQWTNVPGIEATLAALEEDAS
jgi:hypothetical protein